MATSVGGSTRQEYWKRWAGWLEFTRAGDYGEWLTPDLRDDVIDARLKECVAYRCFVKRK